MYNLRYHIASLVAVFLALTIGLLLGTVVAERGTMTEQGSALVEGLQRRFDEISATNEELRLGLERDRAFAEELEPVLTTGVLAGQDVAVVVGTGRVDGLNAVNAALTQAGANPFVASLESPGLALENGAPEGLVGYFAARGEEMADPGPALVRQVADALVAEWRDAGPRPLMELLAEARLAGVEGLEETATVDAIVIMAAAGDGADPFALALGRAVTDAGGVVVGAEADSSDAGVAASCADAGFSAIGHMDTVQGRFSLVWILAGRAEGVYGTKDAAQGYYPPIVPGD